ncbi:poly A polymerase family protein [Wolbachia endosymbiont of Armadillidium vulgare str. wVulC]|uniref:CCA tRNA nucleotidyltransferase n=1 Tax=Wolbachia endosymbiont of Armadillidium vulgare TaxID=77039 RepID=UPI000649A525|nr:CCA tRNA nucleotidyltransferase [Wolbachia endosymbiont of Armadillidium vulgare]KLT22883.1 poly A polymerase family protein [Wolbachia endosymbiont of Armadillidium vulgare str. wVulC]OJH31643.1 CCA-adding enzyme [Wolbachia endosymbiont of Armadillidium vulgare]OJH32052.1 CCA-adding enzyme [Wolbachia endosymbiont of Armadillidium vulgare]OJH32609.1 CCA-adding enzyme [Wolbachia endosymbiont of Armadillidium vulgare]OJH33231.1 CCA-adding enzyme [Wolbachia endosymbiont of Armadillidium vulgar
MRIDHETSVIIDAIEKFGGEARLVGGCVRDSILQRDVHDIDLATNLLPDQAIKALKLRNIKTIPTGLKHGTITAILNQRSFEITTLRHDVKCDGRHAKVEFTNDWQADASRRDFTFNALYADKHGHIYDYFGGTQDLKARRLNFIGNAEDRIKEDYLRILRAFRFHAKICIGDLSDEILDVCKKYSHMIQNLSGERIREEVFKLLECNDPVPTLKSMQKSDVLQKIIPKEVKCEILFSKLLLGADALVKLALLLRTAGSLGEDVSKFLRLSNKQKKKLLFLLSSNIKTELSEKEQKKYISLFGIELYCDLMKICGIESETNVDEYISFANTFNIPKFPLSGNDLISIGHQPGKSLGRSLELLRQHWENSSYTLTKEELILYAKSFI